MNDIRYEKLMKDEINARMKSNAWDFQIASKVLAKKRKAKRFLLAISSLSTVSVASILTLVFLFGFNANVEQGGYSKFVDLQIKRTYSGVFAETKNIKSAGYKEHFVSKQIEGTHNEVFKKKGSASKESVLREQSILLAGEVDSVIDETLSLRY